MVVLAARAGGAHLLQGITEEGSSGLLDLRALQVLPLHQDADAAGGEQAFLSS